MQTQSDNLAIGDRRSAIGKKPRSVFSNFKPEADAPRNGGDSLNHPNFREVLDCASPLALSGAQPPSPKRQRTGAVQDAAAIESQQTLQTAIDHSVTRSFIHRFVAKAFEDPTVTSWSALTDAPTQTALQLAVKVLAAKSNSALEKAADAFVARLNSAQLEDFKSEYVAAFGHAARGRCPLNEIEYGDIKADPLFQPHRLADLGAFYSAFGLEISDDAAERHDHICLELEFMSVLAAKEAYALEHQLDAEQLALCRSAQKLFLREHLGRWTPAFTRRLSKMVGEESPLGALADFTREFAAAECARFDITPGSEDLLLRPVNLADESLCDSCGIASRLPGALQPCGET